MASRLWLTSLGFVIYSPIVDCLNGTCHKVQLGRMDRGETRMTAFVAFGWICNVILTAKSSYSHLMNLQYLLPMEKFISLLSFCFDFSTGFTEMRLKLFISKPFPAFITNASLSLRLEEELGDFETIVVN